MASKGVPPIDQPRFDNRIYNLAMPVGSSIYGPLKRGSMIWEQPIQGYSSVAQMHFLYNPSTVTADYYLADASVGAALQFPTGFNDVNLRIPLSQTVTWSLLFDRTYELWGRYTTHGLPLESAGPNDNNPAVVGVMADIRQMQQFTGMNVGYSSTNSPGSATPSSQTLFNHQGIFQLIPSFVYFGDSSGLWFYGYISEWDVTVTHWTQYMVPMRCVINVTFTMLPTPQSTGGGSNANTNWATGVHSPVKVVTGVPGPFA